MQTLMNAAKEVLPKNVYLRLVLLLAVIVGSVALTSGLVGCVAPNAVVAYTSFTGNGDMRTDGTYVVGLGDAVADAGVFVKGSGFPLTIPIATGKDGWVVFNRKTHTTVSGMLGVDLIPWQVRDMYRPGEIAALSAQVGVEILFEPQPI